MLTYCTSPLENRSFNFAIQLHIWFSLSPPQYIYMSITYNCFPQILLLCSFTSHWKPLMFCIVVIFSSLCGFYLSLSLFFCIFLFFKPMNIFHVYLHRHKCFFTFIPLLSSVFVSVFLFLLSFSFVQRVHGQAWPNSFFGLFVGSCFFSSCFLPPPIRYCHVRFF